MSRKRAAKICRVDADEELREKLDFRGGPSEKPHGVKGVCLNLCQVLFAVRCGVGGCIVKIFPLVILWSQFSSHVLGKFGSEGGKRGGGASAKIVPLSSRPYCVFTSVTMCTFIAAVPRWPTVNSCQKEEVAQRTGAA